MPAWKFGEIGSDARWVITSLQDWQSSKDCQSSTITEMNSVVILAT
jgi:hypothetical protein